MWNVFTILGFIGSGIISAFAATNAVPTTSQVVRYEREQPVFRSKVISRERGDRLLIILQDSTNFVSWGESVRKSFGTNVIGCVLPVPPETWVVVQLTNRTSYKVGIPRSGGLIWLPSGLFEAQQPAREALSKLAEDLRSDLRKEIVEAPRPLTYVPGTIDDGGTLSGIARLFYGDATKWRKIYEANRSVMKNPNLIEGRERLTIPK